MVKDRFDAATKFVDKEDKYNSLLSVQPALDLIHDAITNATIDLKDKILEVMNTNNCYISLCKTRYKNKVILLSAIDNLIKGGAGQAVQNMNLRFGINEYEGLK